MAAWALLLAGAGLTPAQQRADWTVEGGPAAVAPGASTLLRATAHIQTGWHLYSVSSPAGSPTAFQVEPGTLLRVLQPAPVKAFDKNLNAESETFEKEVTFLLEVRVADGAPPGASSLTVKVRFQTCNDVECVLGRWTGTARITVDPAARATVVVPAGYAEAKAPFPASAGAPNTTPDRGWAAFLMVAFGFGLASIFTPCVFPMIPITMSYFLKQQSGERRDGIAQAVVFCLGIIVLFSGIGLLVTVILGPFGLARVGSSPWVNGFIAALFIAFGLSLLGAFEITIPSPILTRLNQSSGKGGFAGALLMGLTFSLASFSCVGPFVGTLLAASATAGGARPAAGMVAFATGLALPFFALALFPSYMKRLPKSGGWMMRVKVVMGFVILAASLKYLSSLDQVAHWGLLTRERFLAAWIVLFAAAGLYLLGFIRLEGIKPDEPVGWARLLAGIAFLAFALSLLPGMFGARLGEVEAYIPEPAATSAPGGGSAGGLVWMKDDYRGAIDRARRENKLVFIDFTGYTCSNCHWMQANMFTKPEIAAALSGFVLVELYTDGADSASEANGQLEFAKFQTSATPFYAIMDADEKVVATSAGATRDPQVYLAFLRKGAVPPPVSAPAAGLAAGIPRVKTLDGAAVDRAAWGGKVVVVNFWATWCAPCVEEIPGFNQIHRELGPKGVLVLGVSMDDGAESVRPFLKKHPMDYTVALGSEEMNETYGLESLPVSMVFDRFGKLVKRFDGFQAEATLRAAVEKAM